MPGALKEYGSIKGSVWRKQQQQQQQKQTNKQTNKQKTNPSPKKQSNSCVAFFNRNPVCLFLSLTITLIIRIINYHNEILDWINNDRKEMLDKPSVETSRRS